VHTNFQILVQRTSLWGTAEARRPRPHDLRHSFAVRTLLGWYRQGIDVDASLPLLSTFLGHSGPAATYWYLEAVPELLGVVAQRLETVLGAES
jgi:integrase